MTYFGEYFKLLERVPIDVERPARLRELSYIVRHDAGLEPWQRTVLLQQIALLQRTEHTSLPPLVRRPAQHSATGRKPR